MLGSLIFAFLSKLLDFFFIIQYNAIGVLLCGHIKRDVAQLGSASGLGPEGRRFESCHPDQKVWEFSSAGRASALQAGCHRFEPCNSHHFLNNVLKYDAGVAQLVEQLICNQQVAGSSPITSSTNRDKLLFIPNTWESSRAAKGGRL